MFELKEKLMEEAAEGGEGGAGGGELTGGEGGAGGGAPTGGASWLDSMPDDLKGLVANKGWEKPDDVVKGYQNLEKMVRGNPDSLLRIPDTDADPKDWDGFYNKLGRPESPDGYEFPELTAGAPIEGFDDWAKNAFHKNGIGKEQASNLLKDYNEFLTQAQQKSDEAYNLQQEEDEKALRADWGAAFDKEQKVAGKGAQALGLDADAVDALEIVLGYGKAMRMLNEIGHKIGEDTFEGGKSGSQDGVMTPQQANDQIQSLKMDKDFRAKLNGGDPVAKQKWDQLHRLAMGAA